MGIASQTKWRDWDFSRTFLLLHLWARPKKTVQREPETPSHMFPQLCLLFCSLQWSTADLSYGNERTGLQAFAGQPYLLLLHSKEASVMKRLWIDTSYGTVHTTWNSRLTVWGLCAWASACLPSTYCSREGMQKEPVLNRLWIILWIISLIGTSWNSLLTGEEVVVSPQPDILRHLFSKFVNCHTAWSLTLTRCWEKSKKVKVIVA